MLCFISTSKTLASESEGNVVGVQELQVLGVGCHLKDDTCYITVDRPVGIEGQCKYNNIRWHKAEENGKEMLSLFLAASMAKRKVRVSIVSDECFSGNGRYPTFNYMSIKPE